MGNLMDKRCPQKIIQFCSMFGWVAEGLKQGQLNLLDFREIHSQHCCACAKTKCHIAQNPAFNSINFLFDTGKQSVIKEIVS